MEMRFNDFVQMLFGSKVKVMVLRTLWKHGEKEYTVREPAVFLATARG